MNRFFSFCHSSAVKSFCIIGAGLFSPLSAKAQATDVTQVEDSTLDVQEDIRINPDFLYELENYTFSFEQRVEPLLDHPYAITIDKKLLIEWLGPLEGTTIVNGKIVPEKQLEINMTPYEPKWTMVEPMPAAVSVDVNALGNYIRPKYRRIQKMRALADKNRETMDQYFPILYKEGEDEPVCLSDSVVLSR